MKAPSLRRLAVLLAAVGFALAVLWPVAASAQTDYPTGGSTTTTTCPVVRCDPFATQPVVVQATSTSSGSLAFTGGNIALLVGLGLVALGGGYVLVRLGRSRHATR